MRGTGLTLTKRLKRADIGASMLEVCIIVFLVAIIALPSAKSLEWKTTCNIARTSSMMSIQPIIGTWDWPIGSSSIPVTTLNPVTMNLWVNLNIPASWNAWCQANYDDASVVFIRQLGSF